GVSWFFSSLARMNASILLRDHVVVFTAGAGNSLSGWNAHQLRPSSMDMPLYDDAAAGGTEAASSTRGSSAPAAIHCSKSAMTFSGSLPDGGICKRLS